MSLFASFICLCILCFSKLLSKKILNPLACMSLLWGIIFFLESLGLYNLRRTDKSTILIMLIGVISFSIGYAIRELSVKKIITIKGLSNIRSKISPNYKLLYILGTIVILFNLKSLINSLVLLLSGAGLDQIRYLAQNTANPMSGTLMNVLNNLVLAPITFAIIPITAIDLIVGKKDKRLIVITSLIIMTKLIGEGGRAQLLYFAIHLIVGAYLGNRNKIFLDLKKNKLKIYATLCLILVVIMIASFSRAGESLKIFTYYYFSMEPTMFEQWTKQIGDIYGYGVASLNGLLFPIVYLLKNITGFEYSSHWSSVYNLIMATDLQWMNIAGEYINANAYVSLFFFFYLDLREIGVIIGSALYGFFSASKFRNAIIKPSTRTICIYSYVLQGILFSFVRFQFASSSYALGYLYLIFLCFKKDSKKKEKTM